MAACFSMLASCRGCFGFPHVMPLGAKSSYFKRQEVKADGLLRPGPKSKHIIFASFFMSSSHRGCRDSTEEDVEFSAGKSVKEMCHHL